MDAVATKPETEEVTREITLSLNEVFNSFNKLEKRLRNMK